MFQKYFYFFPLLSQPKPRNFVYICIDLKAKYMDTLKRCKVVMLSTDNEKAIVGSIVTRPSDNRMAIVNILTKDDTQPCIHQNLYIISDEEIKEGDWFLMSGCIVRQCKSTNKERHTIPTVIDTMGGIHHVSVCEKIIATTDGSLGLPKPSSGFIKAFIDSHNNNNPITDVMVEYKVIASKKGDSHTITNNEDLQFYTKECYDIIDVLNVNLRDNTITIKKIKDSFTREEVYNLMVQAWIRGQANPDCHYEVREKFIEENLK